ncbi:hypothetical protein HPB51_013475 [Rhipicephalus microplus]|uniref:CCHC-type domain-containing protein n=1 Tax=Rhipicephalus microplus TaxID=6941 RepID=A0A9J6E1U6_RHIMP|nr:hypothetical protein HPB51_013475 [Rhipicephalus microplus]
MELCPPVPNITDVDRHVVRCEYYCIVRFCCKCSLPGHERKKCATPRCAWCEQWGHPTWDASCKRGGGDHPPHLCKQRLYSKATTRSSVPQVGHPTVVNAEVQGTPAPKISDKREQGKTIQAAPGDAKVPKSGEKEPRPAEAPSTTSQKPVLSADTPVQAPKHVEVQQRWQWLSSAMPEYT